MAERPLILLFVRFPLKGQVKSRLAAAVGEDVALELYRYFVRDILGTVDDTGLPVRLCYHPPDAGEEMSRWLGANRSYEPQAGADVGARMETAFRSAFASGFTRAVLIGSDIPDLPVAVLGESTRALLTHDAVIGPARDGGYYLIGFRNKTLLPPVFHGMAWSTDTVYRQTLKVFDAAGCRVHRLPHWRDVDTIDDLRDLMARNSDGAFRKSGTMSYLASIQRKIFPTEVGHATIRL